MSRPAAAAFGFAQGVVAVGLGRQPARMHHAVQAHHQGLALDLELGLVEIVDDVLDRQAQRILGENVEDEILDVVGAAAARGNDDRRGTARIARRGLPSRRRARPPPRVRAAKISRRGPPPRARATADARPLRPMASMSAFCNSSCS